MSKTITKDDAGRFLVVTEVKRIVHERVGTRIRHDALVAIIQRLNDCLDDLVEDIEDIKEVHEQEVEAMRVHFESGKFRPMVSMRHLPSWQDRA